MLAALTLVLAALLALSGAAKAARPAIAASALLRAGIPAPLLLARLVAVTEIAVGAAVLAAGGEAGWALAAVYGAFGAFLLWRWSAGDLGRPCGCFGADEAPLGRAHLALDLVAVAVAVAATATGAPGLVAIAEEAPLAAATTAVLAATGAVELRLALTRLPSSTRAPAPPASVPA